MVSIAARGSAAGASPRSLGRTPPELSPPARWRHRRGARRFEADCRPTASGTRHGRAGSSAGTTVASRICNRPASSRISPERAPETAARGGPGRLGWRAGGRRDVTERNDGFASATHRIASHQPSGPSVGRAMPRRYVRSPTRTSRSLRNEGPGSGRRSGTSGRIGEGKPRMRAGGEGGGCPCRADLGR